MSRKPMFLILLLALLVIFQIFPAIAQAAGVSNEVNKAFKELDEGMDKSPIETLDIEGENSTDKPATGKNPRTVPPLDVKVFKDKGNGTPPCPQGYVDTLWSLVPDKRCVKCPPGYRWDGNFDDGACEKMP